MRFVESADAFDADGLPARASFRFVPDDGGGAAGGCGWIEVRVAPMLGSTRSPTVAIRGVAPAGSLGTLCQATCLVEPDSDNLSFAVEAARSRLKDFLRIGEDWQFFDDPESQDAIAQFDRARGAFTLAMLSPNESERRVQARRSMELAIDAGERLATAYAVRTVAMRAPKSPPIVGWTADVQGPDGGPSGAQLVEAARARETVRVHLPPWRRAARGGVEADLSAIDRVIGEAFKAHVPVIMGPLWDSLSQAGPEGSGDEVIARWRAELDGWIELVVQRYGSGVHQWVIASDIERGGASGLSVDDRALLVRHAANRVRALLPRAVLAVESTAPWGDGIQSRSGVPLVRALHRLVDDGAPIHRVIVSLRPSDRSPQRDLLQIAGLLDRLRPTKIPLLCELGVPKRSEARAGAWRKSWSPEVAGAFVSRAAAICLARPWIHGVLWDGRDTDIPWPTIADAVRKVRSRLMAKAPAPPTDGRPEGAA